MQKLERRSGRGLQKKEQVSGKRKGSGNIRGKTLKTILAAEVLLLAAATVALITLNGGGAEKNAAPAATVVMAESAPTPAQTTAAPGASPATAAAEKMPAPAGGTETPPGAGVKPEKTAKDALPEENGKTEKAKHPDAVPYEDWAGKGQIRYVSQLRDVECNGWGEYAWRAGGECTTACISMALSYLGADASPEDILAWSTRTVLASAYGREDIEPSAHTVVQTAPAKGQEILCRMMKEYNGDVKGETSPPVLYLSGAGHNHALLIIADDGKAVPPEAKEAGVKAGTEKNEADGENRKTDAQKEVTVYTVLDPANEGEHHIMVSEEGIILTPDDEDDFLARYGGSDAYPIQIDSLAQWKLTVAE